MGFAGYVSVCLQLYCVSFQCPSLHVSAYMAIFKCVGYFLFSSPEEFCFAAFFLHVVTLCKFPFVVSCAVFFRYFCCFLAFFLVALFAFVWFNNDVLKLHS
jgi:hypothetical protein